MRRFRSLTRAYLKGSDTLLLILCLCCSCFGLVLIASASRSYESPRYLIVQGLSIVIGLALFLLFSLIDSELLGRRWYLLLGFNVALLALLRIFGVEGGTGNRSWIRFAGIGIQPSELLKVTFTLLLARQMTVLKERRGGISGVFSVLQLLAHFALMFGLIVMLSADLGSALVFLFIFAAMCFAGGLNLLWFLAAVGVCAALAPMLWNRFLSDYQRDRILAPYMPDVVDPDGLGITWHARQSKAALASGGLTGQGLFHGTRAQSDLLPYKHTDFIFSVAGEELGLIGCAVIILLLTAIILRVLFTGLKSGNSADFLVCAGFVGMLTFQTFENAGMCLGLTPVIGLTLPFFSYGGSSMVATFAAMGIVSGIRLRANTRALSRRLE